MARIATTCVAYLKLESFYEESSSSEFWRNGHYINRLQFPFFSYAATFWGIHVYRVQKDEPIQQLTIEFLQDPRCVERALHAMLDTSGYDRGLLVYGDVLRWTGIHLASYFGLDEILARIFRQDPALVRIINQRDGWNQSPCYIASYRGHENVVQILLNYRADAGAQGREYSDSLYAASANGHDKIVKIFVDAGADINAEGGPSSNALHTASFNNRYKAVKILVDAGADVNDRRPGGTPLTWAAEA
jgi:hypothetical protein